MPHIVVVAARSQVVHNWEPDSLADCSWAVDNFVDHIPAAHTLAALAAARSHCSHPVVLVVLAVPVDRIAVHCKGRWAGERGCNHRIDQDSDSAPAGWGLVPDNS